MLRYLACVALFELKRDAYYKYTGRAKKRKAVEQHIVAIVKKRRKSLPREVVRKLKRSLNDDFEKQHLKVGRDTLFNVLREHKMLTLRKKIQCQDHQRVLLSGAHNRYVFP